MRKSFLIMSKKDLRRINAIKGFGNSGSVSWRQIVLEKKAKEIVCGKVERDLMLS